MTVKPVTVQPPVKLVKCKGFGPPVKGCPCTFCRRDTGTWWEL